MGSSIVVPDFITDKNGNELKFRAIHEEFAQSDEGKILDSNVRFARYKPNHMHNSDWERLLGADANNLEHLKLSLGLTRVFLRHQDPNHVLSQEDAEVLCLTAITHDWAEAVVGDEMYDLRTQEHDEREESVYSGMLMSRLENRIDIETLEKVYSAAMDKESRLGNVFGAIETLGYMRTGLHAWEVSERINGQICEAMRWLSSNVVGNQTHALLDHARSHHPIREYVVSSRDKISNVFRKTHHLVFSNYPQPERTVQQNKFFQAMTDWNEQTLVV